MSIKEVISQIKKWLSNSKNKSLTQLCLWLIFIIVVFALVSSAGSTNTKNYEDYKDYTNDEQVDDVLNYEFTLTIQDDTNLININGTYYNNTYIIRYNDKNYKLESNLWYDNDTQIANPFNFDIEQIEYNKILELLDISTLNSTTTYNDNTIKNIYMITVSDYNNYYNLSNNYSDNKIIITRSGNSKYLENIAIDLTNLYGYNYNITLNFTNINNISNIGI